MTDSFHIERDDAQDPRDVWRIYTFEDWKRRQVVVGVRQFTDEGYESQDHVFDALVALAELRRKDGGS